jgi:hypothetical protein
MTAEIAEGHHVTLSESEWRQRLFESLPDDPGDARNQYRGLCRYYTH